MSSLESKGWWVYLFCLIVCPGWVQAQNDRVPVALETAVGAEERESIFKDWDSLLGGSSIADSPYWIERGPTKYFVTEALQSQERNPEVDLRVLDEVLQMGVEGLQGLSDSEANELGRAIRGAAVQARIQGLGAQLVPFARAYQSILDELVYLETDPKTVRPLFHVLSEFSLEASQVFVERMARNRGLSREIRYSAFGEWVELEVRTGSYKDGEIQRILERFYDESTDSTWQGTIAGLLTQIPTEEAELAGVRHLIEQAEATIQEGNPVRVRARFRSLSARYGSLQTNEASDLLKFYIEGSVTRMRLEIPALSESAEMIADHFDGQKASRKYRELGIDGMSFSEWVAVLRGTPEPAGLDSLSERAAKAAYSRIGRALVNPKEGEVSSLDLADLAGIASDRNELAWRLEEGDFDRERPLRGSSTYALADRLAIHIRDFYGTETDTSLRGSLVDFFSVGSRNEQRSVFPLHGLTLSLLYHEMEEVLSEPTTTAEMSGLLDSVFRVSGFWLRNPEYLLIRLTMARVWEQVTLRFVEDLRGEQEADPVFLQNHLRQGIELMADDLQFAAPISLLSLELLSVLSQWELANEIEPLKLDFELARQFPYWIGMGDWATSMMTFMGCADDLLLLTLMEAVLKRVELPLEEEAWEAFAGVWAEVPASFREYEDTPINSDPAIEEACREEYAEVWKRVDRAVALLKP